MSLYWDRVSKVIGRFIKPAETYLGEKVVPTPHELRITAHPMVSGAVVFGRGRNECGMLIEPKPEYAVDSSDEDAVTAFRNNIWYVTLSTGRAILIQPDVGRPLKKRTRTRRALGRFSRR